MARPFIIRDVQTRAIAGLHIQRLDVTKAWEVTIRPHKSKRSIDQNSLYWSWLSIIADETGNTANDIHEWCRDEFLPCSEIKVAGVAHLARPSTTALTTKEMTDYLNRIEAWAGTDLGIILPSPDDRGRA